MKKVVLWILATVFFLFGIWLTGASLFTIWNATFPQTMKGVRMVWLPHDYKLMGKVSVRDGRRVLQPLPVSKIPWKGIAYLSLEEFKVAAQGKEVEIFLDESGRVSYLHRNTEAGWSILADDSGIGPEPEKVELEIVRGEALLNYSYKEEIPREWVRESVLSLIYGLLCLVIAVVIVPVKIKKPRR